MLRSTVFSHKIPNIANNYLAICVFMLCNNFLKFLYSCIIRNFLQLKFLAGLFLLFKPAYAFFLQLTNECITHDFM